MILLDAMYGFIFNLLICSNEMQIIFSMDASIVRIIQKIYKLLIHTYKTNTGDVIFDVRVTLKAKRKGDRKVIKV